MTIDDELKRIREEIFSLNPERETESIKVVFTNDDVPKYIEWFQELQKQSEKRPLLLA